MTSETTHGAKWDFRFIELANLVSTWSKDPSTKIGAIAVDSERRILSTGYNGFPRNIEDSTERLYLRETKYKYIVHAEMNVIYNASHSGVSLHGSTIYVSGLPPCMNCGLGIIQAGVKNVVYGFPDEIPSRWLQSTRDSLSLLQEAGVRVYKTQEGLICPL